MSFPNEKNRDTHIQIISTASSVSCQCCQLKEDKREIFTAASLPSQSQVSPQGVEAKGKEYCPADNTLLGRCILLFLTPNLAGGPKLVWLSPTITISGPQAVKLRKGHC